MSDPVEPKRSVGLTRRRVMATAAAAALLPGGVAWAAPLTRSTRSGATLPLVGLGTWITFNVGNDPEGLRRSTAVMRAFFDNGGRLIDSSPMYGSAEAVVGHGHAALGKPAAMFSASKVWTGSAAEGRAQVAEGQRLWGIPKFNLQQVHNLVAWEDHLPMLLDLKAAGRLGHVGITTSHGRRHDEFVEVMRTRPIDFVQVTYNAVDREVERRILPLAAERGIGVIVNRPFRGGSLARRMERETLPGFAADLGCRTWPQLLLKFILAHPAVTCAIPATTRPEHAVENMQAAAEPLPDADLRARIAAAVAEA